MKTILISIVFLASLILAAADQTIVLTVTVTDAQAKFVNAVNINKIAEAAVRSRLDVCVRTNTAALGAKVLAVKKADQATTTVADIVRDNPADVVEP